MNVTNIPTTLYKTKWRRKQRPLPIFLIHINTHLITMLMTSGGMVSHRTYNVHQQALLAENHGFVSLPIQENRNAKFRNNSGFIITDHKSYNVL